jgi:hypothetical protein
MIRHYAAALSYLILFQLFATGRLYADSASESTRLEIEPFISAITYKEPDIMQETGMMVGLRAVYMWQPRSLKLVDTVRLDVLASKGQLDYSSTSSGSMYDILNAMFEARALLGRTLVRMKRSDVSLYSGFGYRHLSDMGGGMVSTEGYLGYDRSTSYLYLPIGIGLQSKLGSEWVLDSVIEYDVLLKGIQTSYMTQLNNAYYTYSNDIVNHQYKGAGFRVAAKFIYDNLAIEPYFRYWNIGKSTRSTLTRYSGSGTGSQVYYVWEPPNNSTEFGFGLSVLF